MRQVLVSYGSDVAIGPTLSDAITKLVQQAGNTNNGSGAGSGSGGGTSTGGGGSATSGGGVTPAMAAALAKIDDAITRAQQAQAAGNFQAYGQALADLQEAMKEYQAAEAAAGLPTTPAPSPTP
jgi:uncharacterized membrane protein (UPF0182 family)